MVFPEPAAPQPRSGAVPPAPTLSPASEAVHDAASVARARRQWRQWLAGGSSREVLARLFQGDPLGLRPLAADVLRERAFALDVGRVYLRSLAYVARFAVRYRGQPELSLWLRERVDEALLDLLREDRDHAGAAAQGRAEVPVAFRDLARPLGLDPESTWRAVVSFNARSPQERSAFCAWILEGRELDDVARESGVSPTVIARRARGALDALLDAGRAADQRGESTT